MRRCKLISPTNLMLEQPILSPVDECEYVLFGVQEYRKDYLRTFFTGLFTGMVLGMCVAALLLMLRFPCLR
jgi:hypothetical protein